MKKLFALFFILALTFSVMGIGYAANDNPDSENFDDIGRFYGSQGITPPTEIIKVRYGFGGANRTDPSLASGDVVVWDIASGDAYTISACVVSSVNAASYAGVLVTSIATATDSVIRNG